MAIITFTIPDTVIQRVITAYTTAFGYSATLINGQPNPETAAAFTKRMISNQIKQMVKSIEGQAAEVTSSQNVESQITIT